MGTHHLLTAIALFCFAWGCQSNSHSGDQAGGLREASLKNQSTLEMAGEMSMGHGHCGHDSLTASPPSPEPSGATISLTAEASCVTVEYRFLYEPMCSGHCGHCLNGGHDCDCDGEENHHQGGVGHCDERGPGEDRGCGPWRMLRDWGPPTFSFDTTGFRPGRYLLRAQARPERGDENERTLVYELTPPCPPGYTGDGAGHCVDINECLTNNGGCDLLTTCTNLPGSRTCGACPAGYTGTGDTACTDINECLTNNGGCDPLTACTNLPGSRTCGSCPAGYTGTGETACILPFVASELVGRPTDHSITINVMAGQVPFQTVDGGQALDGGAAGTYQALEAYFEYGTEPGVYSGSTTPTAFSDGTIETVVDGLGPDTRYHYRMRYRPTGSTADFLAGSEHAFHTQRSRTGTFTFAVQSDSHQGYASFYNDQLYRITMGNIASEQPDFLIDLGDTVSTDDTTETQATVRQKYLNQRTIFDLAAHSMPVFLALGNHENEEGWNLDDFGADRSRSLPVLGANGRKRYFLNPVPDSFYSGNTDATVTEIDGDHLKEDYYAFEWGNALFVVLDPYWYTMKKPFMGTLGGEKDDEVVGNRWDWTLGDQQYHWLKQTLESSTATFKFVFAHQTTGGLSNYVRGGALGAKYCEWGGYDFDGVTWAFASHRPGWEMPIHQLFVKTNVTAFFHGHDHVFAKEVLDGIVYQEVPHAANADYGGGFSTNPQDYADGDLVNNSGHLRVTVAPAKVTVEYVRSFLPNAGSTDGGTIDAGDTNDEISYTYEMKPCEQRDSDGDGANDCSENDGCPGDPNKTAPGVCGCGRPDADSDGDQTLDCKDACPNDSSKVAPGLCGCGHDDAFGCSKFMVVRVGDGSDTLGLQATPAFIEERNLDGGALVRTIPLPTAASGNNGPLTISGSAPVEGTLKRSANGTFATLAGYAVSPGLATVAYTATSAVNRVVGRMAADGTVDTTTAFTSNAFDGGSSGGQANDRAVASVDGTAFWVAGTGANSTGGIWYIPFGATSGTQIVSNPNSVRTCGIFNNQLYGASNVSSYYGVFTVGNGLPTGKATATLFSGFAQKTSPSSLDFAVLDRNRDGSVDMIYVSDDRTNGSGGIQKWTFNGSQWALVCTFNPGASTGIRHLLAVESQDSVTLLAGTTDSGSGAGPNAIVKVVDIGGNTACNGGFTSIATAVTNTAFRGLALSPVP